MVKQKLAIIGANESISFLIKKAKYLGYETHVFAWKTGDVGEKIADYFYPINITNKDEILKICKSIGVCGVCSITSDYAAPIVSYVARNLNLPCNPETTDIVARNKYEMRKAFKDYGGIYCPYFIKIDINYDLDYIKNKLKMPVIVKPTDRWSSKGITRVDTITDLPRAIEFAINESMEKKAIIEEYMDGPEYSAECIVFKGNVSILAYTQKMTTGYPHYIEIGHIQPAEFDENTKRKINITIINAIKALSITNSAAHVEFKILENGEVGIIEIGARMGGDYIGTDLTPISTGLDYIKMIIDVACGKAPDFSMSEKKNKVAVRFILEPYDLDFYNAIKKQNIIRECINFQCDFSKPVVDSSTRHGYFIYLLED